MDAEALRPHVEKLKLWLLSEEGFGETLHTFFRENKIYFDDYQEEHALHYTTLHQDFASNFEKEIGGWLAEEGLNEADLEGMLRLGQADGEEDPEVRAIIDTMLEVLEYDKWIVHIFELKRKIRDRRVVTGRRGRGGAAAQ
eukprot:gnl/TRDRNA2_/TRDRNA2_190815_c0_seq1.p1 gnl/TRDRNA2_/TRDRNA2_190815_c0~~gnl/TRDRNA2_/TRDRNA2_190815_c0_seq1.p1  ORF type:complete len:158 (+),score=39.51 gnl/TRDRNA2_/TRDRNA2_190815_c0_seq1:54-476(+)